MTLIRQNVKARLPGVGGVMITEKRGFVEVDVEGGIVLRFKKVDPKYRSSSYQTRQQRLYSNQLPLFGEASVPTRLTVGYRLDPTATQLVDVAIVYPQGRVPLWAYSIMDAGGSAGAVVPLPTPDAPVQPAKVSSKLRRAERKERTA
ncbi:MAG: hypothetical protein PHU85_11615 [Phycisphaerae bacterium]|nr:hypothetical protein [Phycisphaerae bacterium]